MFYAILNQRALFVALTQASFVNSMKVVVFA